MSKNAVSSVNTLVLENALEKWKAHFPKEDNSTGKVGSNLGFGQYLSFYGSYPQMRTKKKECS